LPTKCTDIAIIGGGLAGSTAATMLGRAGIPTIRIDPPQAYPFDFRVEKNQRRRQLGRFYQTGIADSVLRSATREGESWIARFGYLLDKKPSHHTASCTTRCSARSGRGSAKAPDAKPEQRGIKPPDLLLVIVIIIVIVFIVVVGLSGGVVLPVALVVPQLAIDAVGGEQLRMRAALDRLAA
jgi:hypothetical protein